MTRRCPLLAVLAVAGAGACIAACAAPAPADEPPPSGTNVAAADVTAPASTPSSAPPPATGSSATAAPSGRAGHAGPLSTFYDHLHGLERKERNEHVRIVWLGDSHAQADFWPDAIRRGLQQRFGFGGPGFLHFGMKEYRHAGVKFDIKGGWRMRPKMPSSIEPWGDGAFGLGGILHAGFSGFRAVTADLTDDRLAGRELTIDLCYKPGLESDAFTLEITGGEPTTLQPGKAAIGTLHHVAKRAKGKVQVRVRVKDGRPDFCGLVVETDPASGPGVVLDNLGINGARYATPLAWNEDAWAAEVKRRPPSLFIFEYGGNEASDGVVKPAAYKADALKLIARARNIVPEASCLVIGPSDRVDAEQRIPPIVKVLKEAAVEAKCRFWNTYEIMGGKGSLAAWRDSDRAAPDGVHLTPKGYAEVGALLLEDLMSGYQATR